jgi:hypothetical protein
MYFYILDNFCSKSPIGLIFVANYKVLLVLQTRFKTLFDIVEISSK